MKRTFPLTLLLLCTLLLPTACGKDTTDDAASTTTAQSPDDSSAPISQTLSLTYTPAAGAEETVTLDGSVELTVTRAFAKGDKITVAMPEGQHYLALCLAQGTLEEAILYLPNSTFTYTVPDVSVSYPKELTRSVTITARIPTDEELATARNLALNPADLIDARSIFPHASTTSVHDITNENNRLSFESRNVIDGFTQNTGHGGYPNQSWGPANSMKSTDSLTIYFGRKVNITELIVFLRADFPHDTYWDTCTALFSDGSEVQLSFTKTADAQSFRLEVPVTATSVEFTNFTKVAGSEWAAWMEVQVIGSDIIG